jgi:hypothetical protein
VLVDPHGPQGHHLRIRVGIQFGQLPQLLLGHTGQFGNVILVIFRDELGELIEAHLLGAALARVGGFLFQGMLGAQAVTDIGDPLAEIHVLVDEVLVHLVILDDVIGDVVEHRQVGLW